jgi:hypothetical protein
LDKTLVPLYEQQQDTKEVISNLVHSVSQLPRRESIFRFQRSTEEGQPAGPQEQTDRARSIQVVTSTDAAAVYLDPLGAPPRSQIMEMKPKETMGKEAV